MRISLSRESLKQALDVCGKIVNGKSPREELRCVRIEAKGGKASIQATNLEEWLTFVSSESKVVAEGTCVVDLAELKAFVKDAQPKRFIEIESDGRLGSDPVGTPCLYAGPPTYPSSSTQTIGVPRGRSSGIMTSSAQVLAVRTPCGSGAARRLRP